MAENIDTKMAEEIENFSADADEIENNENVYTHSFKTPFEYENKKYTELTFDFEKLTGADSLSIETELQRKGHTVLAKSFDPEYKIRFAARACTEKIGFDALKMMKVKDYNAITNRVQNFLLTWG